MDPRQATNDSRAGPAVRRGCSLSARAAGASRRARLPAARCLQCAASSLPCTTPDMTAPSSTALWQARWQRYSAAAMRAYHAYGSWLVSISWRRFFVLSVLLLIVVGILHDLPPLTWTVTERFDGPDRTERVERAARVKPSPPAPPPALPPPPAEAVPPAPPAVAAPPAQAASEPGARIEGVDIHIGRDGIRVTPRAQLAEAAEQAASAADEAADNARQAAQNAAAAAEQGLRAAQQAASVGAPGGGAGKDEIHAAIREVRREIERAVREAREAAEEAARDAAEAQKDAEEALLQIGRADERDERERRGTRTTRIGIGDLLMQLTVLWVLASAILKFTYKGRMQAEVKAAQATETAEAESLKRQVVEARMAAMQAQVEPHFLFNTLASIDHLIETDPARASQMQKNLIALLRASMPTMREASGQGGSGNGVRDLGREIAVIRPYLEILKVRMEERLATEIAVPDGLLSAEFPPMMIQTLVENAIKHGLEPKPEGGQLLVRAEIVHGKLQMTVADTGLGFGKAGSGGSGVGSTAGTGVGLANVRERLQMLYGNKASLTITENRPSGTVVTITVPYRTVEGAMA